LFSWVYLVHFGHAVDREDRVKAGARTRVSVPPVTAAVFTVTTMGSVAGLAMPKLVTAWQRAPQGLHGQWWRIVTALFVQDGGIVGTLSNLLFLAVVGTIAERVLTPRRWLVQYFGVGIAAELIGYAWQPNGAGNSIAICGLAGAVAIAIARGDTRGEPVAGRAVVLWSCVAAAAAAPAFSAVIVMGGCAVAAALGAAGRRGRDIRLATLATTLAVGLVLTCLTDIHGIALVMGCVAALIPASAAPRPARLLPGRGATR
jgi:membrane associated rhomboid family serine protease